MSRPVRKIISAHQLTGLKIKTIRGYRANE